jgi:hypothetical protein
MKHSTITFTFAVMMLCSVLPVRAQDTSKPDSADVEKYATFDVLPGGECNLDSVSVDGDDMTLSGWAILSSDANSAPPEPVLLQLVAGSDQRIVANRNERSDVADYFKNDALKMAGFTAVVKKQPGMLVQILLPSEGHLYKCPNVFPAIP